MAAFPPNLSPDSTGASQAPVPSQLSNRPSGMDGSLLQMILAFLAGAGAPHLMDSVSKFMHKGAAGGPKGSKGGQTTGGPPQAQMPPGSPPQQIPPQILLQLLAARNQQQQGQQSPIDMAS